MYPRGTGALGHFVSSVSVLRRVLCEVFGLGVGDESGTKNSWDSVFLMTIYVGNYSDF